MSHQYYFEKLNVWMESKNFAIEVYKITDKFPNDEKYRVSASYADPL